MKKIMVMLAAVAIASAASAASTLWTFTSTAPLKAGYTGQGTSSSLMEGATIYLFALSDQSQDALLDAFRAGTDVTTFALASGTTDSSGKITASNGPTFSTEKFAAGASVSFYSAVLANDGTTDWIFLSATKSVTSNTDPSTAKTITPVANTSQYLIDATGSADFSSAGWYAAAVPEPTSGLLLLLGMAGLALRRKKA